MIQTQSDGSPITQAFIDAAPQPFVGYDVRLFSGGVDTGWGIQRLSIQLGAGASQGDAFEDFALGGLQCSQMEGTLYDVAADPVGSEVELRVGVEVSEGAYEYVTVAHMTVTSAKEWQGITTFRAAGFGFKLNAPLGISGDLSPSQIATAVEAACGVPVALGAFTALPSAIPVGEGATCRRAVEELALRCAGYACETNAGGVMVAPFASASTCAIREDIITAAPEVGEEWQADGLTVTAADAEYVYGTGRVKASVPEATQQSADLMWGNLNGYAYMPGRIRVAVADPRITPFDVMAVPYGQGTVNVPARGIELTCDGGYFGAFSAAGLTAEADEALVEGELTRDVRMAKEAAEEAQAVADAVNQHFWTDTQGIHVTEETQDDFLQNPSGANILENANGILLRDGETWLSQFTPGSVAFYDGEGNASANITAVFGKDGAQLGADGAPRVVIDSGGMTGLNTEDVTLFDISMDGADTTATVRGLFGPERVSGLPSEEPIDVSTVSAAGAVEGTYGGVEMFLMRSHFTFSADRPFSSAAPSCTGMAVVSFDPQAGEVTLRITANRILVPVETDYAYECSMTASTQGGEPVVLSLRFSYTAATRTLKREVRVTIGGGGQEVSVDGLDQTYRYETAIKAPAFTLGTRSGNPGVFTATAGELLAATERNQTAVGKYNDPVSGAAFMLGNGSGDESRSNAMTVDWSGNMVLSGSLTDGDGRSLSDMEEYLPLAGGTLTGALSGTEASFGGISVGGAAAKLSVNQSGTYIGDGPFSFADTAIFKEALGIGARSGNVPQNFGVTASNGADQIFSINATCINANNTAQNGDRFLLIPRNNGLGLYNSTDSGWMWNVSNLTPTVTDAPPSIIAANSNIARVAEARRVIFGKVCQVYVSWENLNSITVGPNGDVTDITIGTLTSSARPAIYCAGTSNGNLGGTGAFYDVSPTGAVKLTACNGTGAQRTIAAGTTFYFYTTFIMP